MKTAVYKPYNRPAVQVPYPNAATRRQLLQKLLDTALIAASGMGIAAIVGLLMAL